MTLQSLPSPGFLAGLIIGLALALLAASWTANTPLMEQQAFAQMPNPGAQRNLLQLELAALNQKMDRLLKLLESGKTKVICVQPDAESPQAKGRLDSGPAVPGPSAAQDAIRP